MNPAARAALRAKVNRLSRTSGKLLDATEPPSDPKATTATTTAARLLRDPRTGGAFLLHEVGSLLPLQYYGGCVNCAPSLRAMDLKGNLSPSALTLLGQGKEHLTVPLDLAFRDDAIAVVSWSSSIDVTDAKPRSPRPPSSRLRPA